MATRVFSDEELEALRSFPTIGKDELIRYFTLIPADEAFLRKLRYAREGKVTGRQPEQQNKQAWCLTVVTNAVVCWHTEYMGSAVGELRGAGREVDAEVLAHVSPARSPVVNHYGSITVDYEHELAQLDDRGHRPLRTVVMDEPGAGL